MLICSRLTSNKIFFRGLLELQKYTIMNGLNNLITFSNEKFSYDKNPLSLKKKIKPYIFCNSITLKRIENFLKGKLYVNWYIEKKN